MILPRFNGWMLPDDAGAFLRYLVLLHKPATVLELGGGRSTLHLVDAVSTYGGKLVSVDHDPKFAAETAQWLARNGLAADVRVAPLVDNWYERSCFEDLDAVEMLFVDGPPGHVAENAREPAMSNLCSRLAPGCVVALDDYNRKAERQTWELWREIYGLSTTAPVRHSTGALVYGEMPA